MLACIAPAGVTQAASLGSRIWVLVWPALEVVSSQASSPNTSRCSLAIVAIRIRLVASTGRWSAVSTNDESASTTSSVGPRAMEIRDSVVVTIRPSSSAAMLICM